MNRRDGRAADEVRPLEARLGVNVHAEGSCRFSLGYTVVHCTASLDPDLPRWRRESGRGWVTAEYRMLPRATGIRTPREGRFDLKGRTAEIQRLVGRALRAVTDPTLLGPRQIIVDCDVLQADGGTRIASVNGGFLALVQALASLVDAGVLPRLPIQAGVAAVSVGLVDGVPLVDLAYDEDARAQVDLNVVATSDGRLVEVQGTAEGAPFPRADLDALLDLSLPTIGRVLAAQRRTLLDAGITPPFPEPG
ncbi:MAG: ribonuclease PH [Deltaproteobacteria bacterium]|nr:ribonuclease PH [Deltaproteobacteria bacterium]